MYKERDERLSRLYACILITLVVVLAIVYSGSIKNSVLVWAHGYPLADKVAIGADDSNPLVVLAVNNDGHVTLFISAYTTAGHITSSINGAYLIGRDRKFVIPELRSIDVNEDGLQDIVLLLEGEVFTYLHQAEAVFVYSPESSSAVAELLQ